MTSKIFVYFCFLSICSGLNPNDENRRSFPDNFLFGTATSSYQVEGGWNASDKSESIWDRLVHTTDYIADGSTGDIACDSYNQYKRDIEMITELEVDFYRFSLSWPRILPDGFSNKISADGIKYYNDLINGLLAANITPFVTLYHWDLPQNLQDLGGWTNPLMVDYFLDYADVVFRAFGDRVRDWLTFNEPLVICVYGYGDEMAPALDMSGIADYMCARTLVKAHAEVYHLYDRMYRPSQKGRISITVEGNWYEQDTNSTADVEAADTAIQFFVGLFTHPIYSKDGDFPEIVKKNVREKSIIQGYPRSRLPEFTKEEIDYIKGTYDFFGLNHYTSYKIKHLNNTVISEQPSYFDDMNLISYQDPTWPGNDADWIKIVPWGFRKALNWVKDSYDNPEIIVFESGCADTNTSLDTDRINYYKLYLNSLLDAIDDGCNITGYTAWSLMDNFEWLEGYTQRFGLYYVDFEDDKRTRTPKSSALFYADIVKTKSIEEIQLNNNVQNFTIVKN